MSKYKNINTLFWMCSFMGIFPGILGAMQGEFGPWGEDSALAYEGIEGTPLHPSNPFGWAVRGVVSLHQMVFSEADGPRSHFRPSSSQYMVLAVQKYGVTYGVLMGLDRLMRENSDPWIYARIAMGPKNWMKWDPP